jgi:hypothetical protein
MEKYNALYSLLKQFRNSMDSSKIVIAKEHAQLAERAKVWLDGVTDDVTIYNIDHHHDLGYEYDDIPELMIADSSNWGLFIAQKFPVVKNFIWIGSDNSVDPPETIRTIYPNFEKWTDIDKLNFMEFDEIFMCLSPDYVPPEYYGLFNILEDTLDSCIKK